MHYLSKKYGLCSKPCFLVPTVYFNVVYLHPLYDFGATCPFEFLDYKIRIHGYFN